jgi:hypothetical protein
MLVLLALLALLFVLVVTLLALMWFVLVAALLVCVGGGACVIWDSAVTNAVHTLRRTLADALVSHVGACRWRLRVPVFVHVFVHVFVAQVPSASDWSYAQIRDEREAIRPVSVATCAEPSTVSFPCNRLNCILCGRCGHTQARKERKKSFTLALYIEK